MYWSKLRIFTNRIGGIVIWVGIWNLIDIAVDDNIIANALCSLFGLFLWVISGEFDEPTRYVEIKDLKGEESQT